MDGWTAWCVFHNILQDTRKALRHHKARNHAVIATDVGNRRGSLTLERVGAPHTVGFHVNLMLAAKSLTGEKGALIKLALLSSNQNQNKEQKQHPFSHATVCKFGGLWEEGLPQPWYAEQQWRRDLGASES